jgi:serine/threonine-protein kinase PknK
VTARSQAGGLAAALIIVAGCIGPLAGDAKPKPTGASWSLGPPAPAALTEVAAAAHKGRIWVAGGLTGSGLASDQVLVFDPAGGEWQTGPRLPDPIHHSALVSDGDGLWLIGGYIGHAFDTPTATVLWLQEDASEWIESFPLPEPRAAGAAAWDGTAIVYGGGVEPGSVASEVLIQGDHGWTTIGRLQQPREHLAAASDGAGRTMLLGGRVGGLDGNLATVDLVEGGAVRSLGELPTARGGVAAFWWPGLGGCLVGGESPGGTNAEVECLAPDGTQTRLNDLAVARHGLGAVVLDGAAWVLLGGREPGLFVSDVVETLVLP